MTEARPDCPFLGECTDAYREASARAASLRARLSPEQLTWKPDDRTWSVIECIEHLNITVAKQIERMRVGVLEARSRGQTGGTPPFGRGTWGGRFLVGAMQKERKIKSLKSFDPSYVHLDTNRVFDDFRTANQELTRLAMEADGLDLGKTKVASAPTKVVKMTIAQAFRLHALHHHRHLDQAQALLELDAFPG